LGRRDIESDCSIDKVDIYIEYGLIQVFMMQYNPLRLYMVIVYSMLYTLLCALIQTGMVTQGKTIRILGNAKVG